MTRFSIPELIAALSERIANLERQIYSQPLAIMVDLKESIANHDRQLQNLRSGFSALDTNLRKVQTDLKELKPGLPAPVSTRISPAASPSPVPVSPPTPVPSVSPYKSLKRVEFPLQHGLFHSADPLNGII
jgi:uncharacterized coiled-coil protein SlyX